MTGMLIMPIIHAALALQAVTLIHTLLLDHSGCERFGYLFLCANDKSMFPHCHTLSHKMNNEFGKAVNVNDHNMSGWLSGVLGNETRGIG